METPVRIQRSRQVKQVSPNGLPIVYVGRGSRLGNPFRIVKHLNVWMIKTYSYSHIKILVNFLGFYDTKEEATRDAILCYELWLNTIDIVDLKSKNLSCWCKLDEACHADLLLKKFNK